MKPANSKTTVEEFLVEQATHWNAKEVIEAWQEFIDSVLPISSATPTKSWMHSAIVGEPDMSVGEASVAKKPRRPRRRKEVTADKFIVLRVTEELYQKVRSASELAGTDTSKWVRQAVLEQLSK